MDESERGTCGDDKRHIGLLQATLECSVLRSEVQALEWSLNINRNGWSRLLFS